jgi:predicted RNase H-like HicB family nuclease
MRDTLWEVALKKVFTIIVCVRDDGSLYARVEELKGCMSIANTLHELFERLQSMIRLCLRQEDSGNDT